MAKALETPYRGTRAERTPDRVVPGGCNICFNACTVKFHFQGEELVKITGNEDDPALGGKVCPKSQMSIQLYHNDRRLTSPLKRVGERGEGRFEPVSWDTALDDIATRLSWVREEFGPEALAIFSGTRAGIITRNGYIRLFTQLWGTPNVEGTEPLCASGKNLAYRLVQGSLNTSNSYTPGDIGSAEMYLYVGDNQAETRPVYFGMINDWRVANRSKLVVVDPRLTPTASKADSWLAIRTGTDLALGLAVAHHILANSLEDAGYCRDWVLGWEAWRDFLIKQAYTPAWAAPITGLSVAEIETLAEDIARADGCMIFASRGVNQHTNSVQTNWAWMFVAAITGNWGRKGGGFFNMTEASLLHADAPVARRADITRPMVRKNPTAWLDAMTTGKPYPIRALITGNNPMAMWPDQNAVSEAFKALDLIVHIDLFENETSAFADYVLPVATGIEKGGISRANDDRRIVWNDKMIDPPGEAKADGWMWIELGKRFGFDDVLKEEYKDIATFWDAACINNEELRGCTQKRLHATPYRWVRMPVASEDAVEKETLFLADDLDDDGKRFPTPSGKLEFWSELQEASFQTLGLSALPEFYSEREQLVDLPHLELLDDDSAEGIISPFFAAPTATSTARIVDATEGGPGAQLRAAGYDTELISGRPPAPHFHSWTHYFWQPQEMWPDQFVQIHPQHAAARKIADGDRIVVETPRGSIEGLAWVTAGIRKDAVFVPIGWGERQPFNPWKSVNGLTDRRQRDVISDQTNMKTLLCRVRPAP